MVLLKIALGLRWCRFGIREVEGKYGDAFSIGTFLIVYPLFYELSYGSEASRYLDYLIK